MNTIIIPTSQNIELEYPIASLGDRFFAFLIDTVIQAGYMMPFVYVLKAGIDIGDGLLLLLLLPVLLYSLLCETFFQGQSLGKYFLKIRVVKLDGSVPDIGEYLLRWVFRLIDIWSTAGIPALISFLLSKNGQRLGDLTAGTSVVKLELVTTFADTIFMDTEDDYEVVFPEIRQLSDRDISIMKELLDTGIRSAKSELLGKLAVRIKEVAQIESSMSDQQFLETVLKDYNHLFGRG